MIYAFVISIVALIGATLGLYFTLIRLKDLKSIQVSDRNENEKKILILTDSIENVRAFISKSETELMKLDNQFKLMENSFSDIKLDLKTNFEKLDKVVSEVQSLNLKTTYFTEDIERQKGNISDITQYVQQMNGSISANSGALYNIINDNLRVAQNQFYNAQAELSKIQEWHFLRSKTEKSSQISHQTNKINILRGKVASLQGQLEGLKGLIGQ